MLHKRKYFNSTEGRSNQNIIYLQRRFGTILQRFYTWIASNHWLHTRKMKGGKKTNYKPINELHIVWAGVSATLEFVTYVLLCCPKV